MLWLCFRKSLFGKDSVCAAATTRSATFQQQRELAACVGLSTRVVLKLASELSGSAFPLPLSLSLPTFVVLSSDYLIAKLIYCVHI